MTQSVVEQIFSKVGLGPLTRRPVDSDWRLVNDIKARAASMHSLTDLQIRSEAQDLLSTVRNNSNYKTRSTRSGSSSTAYKLDDATLARSFSLVHEAVRRVTGKTYFPVQLLAGIALVSGSVAEMKTGEGKTLTSALATFNCALRFRSVHVATPSGYLAERDREELLPVFDLLGLTVGLLPEKYDPKATSQAYRCDITYGAGYNFGFDFLRDDLTARQKPVLPIGEKILMALRGTPPFSPESLQQGLHCCLIDEIDSVLLDEAMTPLILSMTSQQPPPDAMLFRLARLLTNQLQKDVDFQTSPALSLTASGWEKTNAALAAPKLLDEKISNDISDQLRRPWNVYVENALTAKYFLKVDVDFVVRNNLIQIVDQKTGRIFSDRSWRNGLQQAVEEFVGVDVSKDKSSAGRITRQAYYRMYTSMCGMTGTATGAEAEFQSIYRLKTLQIPQNRESLRDDLPDRYFASRDAKFQAIVEQASHRHAKSQPVLIGTRTIEDSQLLSTLLKSADIPHVVLNGKQDRHEAEIVAEAGHAGQVTVATNMAGRGTDIKLDASALAVGGLHVIGVERHESRRIDNQLAGRAARAGKPGSCQFFLSAEDSLLTDHSPQTSRAWKRRADRQGEVRENQQAAVARLQRICEANAFHTRMLMMQKDREMVQLVGRLTRRSRS